ncbi:MAG TPA: sugar transferase [Solirubrobacteraceae bacterium]|nr:sugar transferase [Solirubrobacteraceae bacterium]
MTPTPAASHVEQPSSIALRRSAGDVLAGPLVRLLEPHCWRKVRLLVDIVVLYLASSAALFADPAISGIVANRWLAAIFPLLVLAFLRVGTAREDRLGGSLLDSTTHVLGAVSLAAMVTIGLSSITGGRHPVGIAVRLWLFGGVYLAVARAVLLSTRRQATRSRAFAIPTLIVGAGRVGEHIVKRLVGEPGYGLRPVGYLDDDPLPTFPGAGRDPLPILGGPEGLAEAVARTGARHVILAFSTEPDHVLVDRVTECETLGVEVSLVPRLYESINDRATLEHIGGLPLLRLRPINPRGWQFALKHGIDRTVAAIALIVLSPVMLAVAIAVRRSSSGPILFRQRRVGRDGHEFDVLKFRTMYERVPAGRGFEPPTGLAPGGVEGLDRRTPVGRKLRDLSLDELPQLINVLRGDMSLVGPRPERPEYVRQFVRDVSRYEDRHRVKSGITGWAQVNGLRGQTSIADRVEWDNYYIRNWSLRLDLRIAVLTVGEMLRFRDSATSRPGTAEAVDSSPARSRRESSRRSDRQPAGRS